MYILLFSEYTLSEGKNAKNKNLLCILYNCVYFVYNVVVLSVYTKIYIVYTYFLPLLPPFKNN